MIVYRKENSWRKKNYISSSYDHTVQIKYWVEIKETLMHCNRVLQICAFNKSTSFYHLHFTNVKDELSEWPLAWGGFGGGGGGVDFSSEN